jgi:hypothetical protein
MLGNCSQSAIGEKCQYIKISSSSPSLPSLPLFSPAASISNVKPTKGKRLAPRPSLHAPAAASTSESKADEKCLTLAPDSLGMDRQVCYSEESTCTFKFLLTVVNVSTQLFSCINLLTVGFLQMNLAGELVLM